MIPKFRAWHKANKKMYKVNGISYPLRMLHLFRQDLYVEDFKVSFDDVIITQSTGLFDKNEVEIFEGDILKCNNTVNSMIWLESVYWDAKKAQFISSVIKTNVQSEEGLYNLFLPTFINVEIIGNIQENPELVQE